MRQVFVAFVSGIVLLGVVLLFLGLDRVDDVPLELGYAVTAGVGLLSLGGSVVAGPRLDPTDAGTLLASYRTRFFVRLAAGEVPALVGFAMSFVVGSGFPFLVALPFTAIGFLRAAPTAAAITRDDEALATTGSALSLRNVLYTPVDPTP